MDDMLVEFIAMGVAAETAARRGYYRHWYTICEQSKTYYKKRALEMIAERNKQ